MKPAVKEVHVVFPSFIKASTHQDKMDVLIKAKNKDSHSRIGILSRNKITVTYYICE